MLKGPVRIVPKWKELQEQLLEKVELQKGTAEAAEMLPILLSDRSSIIFRESNYPRPMPLIVFYAVDSVAYFAAFAWRKSKGHKGPELPLKIHVWLYNLEEETSVTEYPLEEDPKVLLVVHIPCMHIFVAYCEDVHFRLFSDHTQDFKLLSKMTSPFSITSMCFNPETGEIVTGAIGVLAFWSFVPGEIPYISATHEFSIESGEFVHFLALEQERNLLVALCENVIRIYDYRTKAQTKTFQVSQGVSLTCCTASWSQNVFYTGDLVGDVKVWNFDTGKQTSQFKAHQSTICSIICRSSTLTLMTASLDGMLKEWNLMTCEQLRRVDIGEEVFQMQFINEQTLFLRTRHTFSIRTVNNFYQLFNRTKSKLKKLMRVQCRLDKARILASTEDGVVRFLSPITGEMLFVTWPFQALEKALDYVYDPDREELLVTMGTADIYVLDTTRNPCPIKYILRAADSEDRVLCLAYSCLDLAGRTLSFIFSGFKSGKVRTLTQHLYRMRSRKLHDGNVVALASISSSGHQSYRSRETSYLCSYGLDEYIILSDIFLKKSGLLEVKPLVVIPSTHCRINHLLLIPGYICVLTEQNRVRLWRQAALVPGQKNPFWMETDVLHSTTITSFDYCHTLNMLVTGGSDGSVRIWDILGQLLVEFDTSLRFSQVCFANHWGDLVVGCNMNIYFISCITYLPGKYTSMLANRRLRDDMVERPLPFLPNFLLTFDIVFVPKYRQVGKQAMKYERLEPISNHKEVVLENSVATVVEFVGKAVKAIPDLDLLGLPPSLKDDYPEFAVEYEDLPQGSLLFTDEKIRSAAVRPPPYRGLPALEDDVPLIPRIQFQAGRTWALAPDGYVPNSAIRAQLFPKGTPKALQCSLMLLRQPLPKRKLVKIQLPEWDESEVAEKARKKKAMRNKFVPPLVETQRRRDLLSEIVAKPWLRHKPSEISLHSVMNAILSLMDDVPFSTYMLCTTTLVQLSEAYELPPELRKSAFARLIQDTKHKEVRMRLAAWEALGKMDLLGDQDVVVLARALLDDNKKVRDLARSLLDSVAGITDKYVLKKEMQRLAEASLGDVSEAVSAPGRKHRASYAGSVDILQSLLEEARMLVSRVEDQLTDNLFLLSEPMPTELRRSSRPHSTRRRLLSGVPAEDLAKSDDRYGAEARWLGLFGRSEKKASQTAAGPGSKSTRGERQPRIRQAQGKELVVGQTGTLERVLESSSSSSSSSGSGLSVISESSSLSISVEERYARKVQRRKERRHRPKAPSGSFHDTQAAPLDQGVLPPVLLQRRDTRSQLYTEIARFQKEKKEHAAAAPGLPAMPLRPKREASTLMETPSKPELQKGPSETPSSLIDPKRQYSSETSTWRQDLYKLMMLRIAPLVEGRTVTEDLLASMKCALAGRSMSWEAFATSNFSLRASPEEMEAEKAKWQKYVEDMVKSPPQVSPSEESVEAAMAVRGKDAKGKAEGAEVRQAAAGREQRESSEELEGPERRPGKESKLAARRKAKKMPEREVKVAEKAEKAEKAGAEKKGEISREKIHGVVSKEKEREVSRDKIPGFLPRGKEREAPRARDSETGPRAGREPEVAKGREAEVAKGREKEPEAAARREPRGLRGREREREPGRGRELGREEKREKEAGKEAAKKKAEEPTAKISEKEWKEMARESVRKAKALLTDSDRLGSSMTKSALSEMQLEAKERMLAELRERAMAEAQKIALDEVKEKALVEARLAALSEAREQALLKARKKAISEQWEKILAQSRRSAEIEMMEFALARAYKSLAEELGDASEEEIWQLARAQAVEMVEARAIEKAQATAIVVDEERVLQLIKEETLELDDLRILELAQERAWALAKERAEVLAEERLLELTKEKEKQLMLEEEWRRTSESRELMEEEDLWEDMKEDSFSYLSQEEKEALLAMLEEEEEASKKELELSGKAELFLEILTEPEKLESSDSDIYQRLFRAASLLEVPSTSDIEDMAETLLKKAGEILEEGKELEDKASVWQKLQEALEARKPWHTDPVEFAGKMRDLQKVALSVLRAQNLKKQLQREAMKKAWQEGVEKEWVEDEVRIKRKRVWLGKKLKEALGKWRAQEAKSDQEKLELRRHQKRLQFRARPIVLAISRRERRKESKLDKQKVAMPVLVAGEEELLTTEEDARELARAQERKLTWSLAVRRQRAWKSIVQMEEVPMASEHIPQLFRPKRYRIPKDDLYKTTKPAAYVHRKKLRRKGLQHIFHLEEQAVDWERFTKLYQSLLFLKSVEGGVGSTEWQDKSSRLLDIYGTSNPLIQTMIKQALMGDRHQRKYIRGVSMRLRKVQANLGERILSEIIHYPRCPQHRPPTSHGVIPLSYQNNVQTFQIQGVAHFGTLSLKWKTFCAKGKPPQLRFSMLTKDGRKSL